jgi:hypothetical protein
MKARTREKIFLSYSRRDRSIYEEVKQELLDRGLLPRQVWHHFVHVREAASRDAIHRLEIPAGGIPAADELLYKLASHLGVGTDIWEDGLDRLVGETQTGERVFVSLEWQVPSCPAGEDRADWRRQWLAAWFGPGTEELAAYRRQGVLILHSLLVEAQAWRERGAESGPARPLGRRPGFSPPELGRGCLAGGEDAGPGRLAPGAWRTRCLVRQRDRHGLDKGLRRHLLHGLAGALGTASARVRAGVGRRIWW